MQPTNPRALRTYCNPFLSNLYSPLSPNPSLRVEKCQPSAFRPAQRHNPTLSFTLDNQPNRHLFLFGLFLLPWLFLLPRIFSINLRLLRLLCREAVLALRLHFGLFVNILSILDALLPTLFGLLVLLLNQLLLLLQHLEPLLICGRTLCIMDFKLDLVE